MTARTAAAIALLLFLTLPAHAQRVGRVEETNTNIDTYHFYVQPGAATVQVQVLGTVQSPGLYELSEGTDLGTLLALTGGPSLNPREPSQRRTVTIRLYRAGGAGGPNLAYEATLDEAIGDGSQGAYPPLQDGDVLSVEVVERVRFNWRDIFTVLSAVAAVVYAIDRIASE